MAPYGTHVQIQEKTLPAVAELALPFLQPPPRPLTGMRATHHLYSADNGMFQVVQLMV